MMLSENKYQELSQIDYCLSQYYSRYMASVLEQENRKFVNEHNAKAREYTNATQRLPSFGAASNPFSKLSVAEQLYGKSSDVMLERTMKRWNADKKIQEDLSVLSTAFHQILVEKHGGKDSKQLRDYASQYIADRIQEHVACQLARKKVPKSTIDYICRKAFTENMIVSLAKLSIRNSQSELDDQVDKRTEAMYKPSISEKAGATLAGYGVDIAASGGVGIVTSGVKTGALMFSKQLASWVATDYAFAGAGYVGNKITGKESKEEKTKKINRYLLGDEHASEKIRQGASLYKKQGTEMMDYVNSFLNHKIHVKLSATAIARKESNAVLASHKGDSKKLYDTIRGALAKQAIPVNVNRNPPAWMFNFSAKKNRAYAASFYAYAMDMSKSGKTQMKLNGKMMTLKEVSQRAVDYAYAAVITDHTYRKVAQAARKQQQVDRQQTYASHTSSALPYARLQSHVTNGGNAVDQAHPSQAAFMQGSQTVGSPTFLKGWGKEMESMGLSDFSTVSKNLGYVLAMLPDMLIGMFTGKNPNMKLQDNLMPLAAIVGGMFIRNPLIKMLLIGFGGANILNNAGHASIKEGLSRSSSALKMYKNYEDEKLNPRITDVTMKGGSMIATIDGNPCVINISTSAADAYQKGAIPMNTLANAVLNKYDENRALASHKYEQMNRQENSVPQQIGIK